MIEYGPTHVNADLALCSGLRASWQCGVEHVRALRVSFVLSFGISDPLAREDLSKRGWSHAWSCLISFVLPYFYFHPSGSRTMHREE